MGQTELAAKTRDPYGSPIRVGRTHIAYKLDFLFGADRQDSPQAFLAWRKVQTRVRIPHCLPFHFAQRAESKPFGHIVEGEIIHFTAFSQGDVREQVVKVKTRAATDARRLPFALVIRAAEFPVLERHRRTRAGRFEERAGNKTLRGFDFHVEHHRADALGETIQAGRRRIAALRNVQDIKVKGRDLRKFPAAHRTGCYVFQILGDLVSRQRCLQPRIVF